jgi:hypothetical protein
MTSSSINSTPVTAVPSLRDFLAAHLALWRVRITALIAHVHQAKHARAARSATAVTATRPATAVTSAGAARPGIPMTGAELAAHRAAYTKLVARRAAFTPMHTRVSRVALFALVVLLGYWIFQQPITDLAHAFIG